MNRLFGMGESLNSVKIGRKVVGEGKPVFVVAEIASAHQGKPEVCKDLVKRVGQTGADAVKFQKFKPEELVVSGSRQEHFKRIEMTEEDWRGIISVARKHRWEILSDVFDEESCDFMDEMGVSAFKIHSSDLSNPYLISHVADKGKPLLLGTGGARLEEIKNAVKIAKSRENGKIILIHGFQAYPTKLENTNLRLMGELEEEFGLNVGYHDHIDAESELALFLPSVAVAFGATLIEKHVILDRKGKGLDYQSALTPSEFKRMIENIRDFEKTLGSGKFEFSAAEKKYRLEVRKNIVAKVDIPAGVKIDLSMLAFKRSKPGLAPSEAKKIIGQRVKKDIKKDEVIGWEKLT